MNADSKVPEAPNYGLDAPGVVRNLFVVAAADNSIVRTQVCIPALCYWSRHGGHVRVHGRVDGL